jgi:proline racemase
MRTDGLVQTVDFHTAGIAMRLVVSGIPRLPGTTLAEKRRHFQAAFDHLRTGLCLPPRGHRSMLFAVMTDPVTPGAHFGLLFMFPGGYYVSCGEATIGAATCAVATGIVPAAGGDTAVVIDTEAGPVRATAHLDDGRVRAVTLHWLPSYVAVPEQSVKVPDLGEVPVDIAVGVGNVFAVVEAGRLGTAIRPERTAEIAARGMALRAALNEQLVLEVPGVGRTGIDNVLVHELPDADGVSPNALVWGPGQVDPAPCGSGTCARMALFHHRGRLAVGGTLVSQGLLGLAFTGRVAGETEVAGRRAILPEVTGTAYLTGTSQFFFDPEDPLRHGYLL